MVTKRKPRPKKVVAPKPVEVAAKPSVAEQIADVKRDVDTLRAKLASGSKTEMDLAPAALMAISAKLNWIK